MKEITEALTGKLGQVKKLQREIDALQKAAGILAGRNVKAKAKTKSKAKSKAKVKAKVAQAKAKKRERPTMSAEAKRAVSKRMKAYWAKRRKAKR